MGSAAGGLSSIASGALGASASGAGTIPQANEGTQISNAQNTYGTATSDAAQTMNTAQAYNQNAQNTLNKTIGSNTTEMNNVNNTANQNLQTYGNTFVPLQQQQAQQAKDYTSGANIANLQGQATSDVNQASQAALANQRQSLASEGVDPASVHGNALGTQAAIQNAGNVAGAMNQSYLNTQATGRQLVAGANQLGMQVGAAGTQGAETGAGIGSSNVANTNQTNSSGINNLTAANTYLNTGVNANNSATTAANDQFNQQQTSYQDAQQAAASQGSGISSMISGALPIAAMMMAGGGPVSAKGALPYPLVPGSTDTKLAALTPGEFVIPKDVTQHLGHEKLHKLIDKTREEIGKRRGIPEGSPMLSSVHTSPGM